MSKESKESKVNTTESLTSADGAVERINTSLEKAKKHFENEKLVEVSVPKSFKERIGSTLFLAINGVHIVLPVDGTKHKVPEGFAKHLQEYLNSY